MKRIAEIKFENEKGYFVADLENGWIRVGLLNCECFDFPAGHEGNLAANALTAETVEDFYDQSFGQYASMCLKAGLAI